MEMLRFATAGSVDDGKSTLIGRLLYDTKTIFEDQLEHVEAVSKRRGNDYVDLALLTDGLRAERESNMGIRALPTAELALEGVRVDAGAKLGGEAGSDLEPLIA